MKHRKVKFLIPLASALALAGCNESQSISHFIEVGMRGIDTTCQVGLAFVGERVQPLNATFDVYVGARRGFGEDWENDLWGCNPGYGKFAIGRIVQDEAGSELRKDYFVLDDFPNDEKYLLTYETIEGTWDGVIPHYDESIQNTFDFGSIDISMGAIIYYLCYYDDVNQKEFEENCYLYGISQGGGLNFEKIGETVAFSKWMY